MTWAHVYEVRHGDEVVWRGGSHEGAADVFGAIDSDGRFVYMLKDGEVVSRKLGKARENHGESESESVDGA